MMQTLDQTNVDLQKKLIQLVQELPSDRLEQLDDFARFVLSLEERERSITRTPEQLKAIEMLFADPRPRGLYDALCLSVMRNAPGTRAHTVGKSHLSGILI